MSTIDSFGKVFYPDCNKDTIHGAKLFSINKEVFIEFDYPTYKLPRKPDIILGEFTGLGPVTCMDNELFGFQSGQGGNLCKYKVTYLITGLHFPTKKLVLFDAAVFQINSLVDWFNIRTFTHDIWPLKTVNFGPSQSIELNISGLKGAHFIFTHDFNSKRHSLEANEQLVLSLKASNPISINQFYDVIIKLKKLFSFLTDSTLIIDDISLYLIKKNIDSKKDEDPFVKFKLYYNTQEISPMPTSKLLNIKYIDIREYFPSLLTKWLKLAEENLVIDLLMEKGYNQELSEKTYFLNICFAFEIYHKTNVSDQKLPNEEFKKLKDYFKKTIKNLAAKDWINSKLGLGNFPSFKDRLVHFKNELGAIYYLDAETLINRIIHTRNSLVHSSSKSQYTITDDFELYLISLTLETVIKGAILTKLGVETENVLKIYGETKRHIDHLVKRNNSEWLI